MKKTVTKLDSYKLFYEHVPATKPTVTAVLERSASRRLKRPVRNPRNVLENLA